MMEQVKFARLMGFCAGPENMTFHACSTHESDLRRGDMSLFFPLKNHDVREATEAEQEYEECYFCRAEEGPRS